MTPELATIIGAIAGFVLLVALVVTWWINRTPRVERHEGEVLPLFGGMTSAADPEAGVMAGGAVRQQPRVPTPAPAMPAIPERPVAAPPAAPPVVPRPIARPMSSAAPERQWEPEVKPKVVTFTTSSVASPANATARATPPSPAPLVGAPVVSAAGVPGTMVEGQLLRFSIPAEGTLQFLPGRLEIASGMDTGRDIRFVRVPGPDGTVVTFGRSEGELYRHIQLRDQTVSRQHARLRLADGHWHLLNLSQTNPVVHNGRVLSDGEEQQVEDGDRIEMGEVIFTFRSR